MLAYQGQQDAEGYVTLTGRLKELINVAGEKVCATQPSLRLVRGNVHGMGCVERKLVGLYHDSCSSLVCLRFMVGVYGFAACMVGVTL